MVFQKTIISMTHVIQHHRTLQITAWHIRLNIY